MIQSRWGRAGWPDAVWLLVWGLLSTAWCVSAGREVGVTFDEPFYVAAGLSCCRAVNHKELLKAGTMPLPVEVQVFPLFLAKVFLGADPLADLATWLPWARLGNLLFWWLLLLAALLAGRSWGGPWAGRLAVALLACEPTFLGHASLATTDVAFTACLLTLLVVFRATRHRPTRVGRVLPPGLAVGFTLLAKASGLVYVPACLLVLEGCRLWEEGWRPRLTWEAWRGPLGSARDLALMGAVGLACVFLVCPRAFRAFYFQIIHQGTGHGLTYLLGQTSEVGFWYYFPLVMTIKAGLPLLALGALVLLARPRRLLNAPFLTAVALTALSTTFRVQVGVRLVLPILVLYLVGLAVAWASRPWPAAGTLGRLAVLGLAVGLVAWSLVDAWAVWPNGLGYVNALWGEMRDGYRVVGDSNFDWGQGVKELAGWQSAHGHPPVSVWYFGRDPLLKKLPLSEVDLWERSVDELHGRCQGSFLAVSTSLLYGYAHDTRAGVYLRGLQPRDRVSTFLIYDFTSEYEPPALTRR